DGARAVCWLIYTLQRCAFGVSLKKFQAIATSTSRSHVAKILQQLKLPTSLFAWGDSADLLGCTLTYDETGSTPLLRVACNREERLRLARQQATLILQAVDGHSAPEVTKSFIFSLGGNLSYDCAGCHATDRVLADTIRSWFAQAFATTGWRDTCDFSKLSESSVAVARALMMWVLEVTGTITSCFHESPLRESSDPLHI
ncbi:hypothetical protein FOL46_004901, partial [Perkinsus olseni]